MNNKQIFKQEIKKYTPLELFIGTFSFLVGGIGLITALLIAWNWIEHVFGK